MSSRQLQFIALSCIALAAIGSCRGRSPDAGGDTSLARDLAEVQLAGTASAPPSPHALASDSGSRLSDSLIVAASRVGARGAVKESVTQSVANGPGPLRRTPVTSHSGRTRKLSGSDPCAAPDSSNQNACVKLRLARSNSRLNSVYRSIVIAVRKQQRVRAHSPNPPYVSQLNNAQNQWIEWRDGECQRRLSGYKGELWGPPQAQCLIELSEGRAAELDQILKQLRRR